MRNSGQKFFKKYNLEQFTSVRAMQSMLDMSVNAKIPDDLVHKLSFEHFRIKFQCLERLWFNFKIYGISTVVLVVFKTPFMKIDRRS